MASTRLLAAHEAIAEAIADSDVETTSKWMERHVNDFRKGYEMSGFDIDRSVEAPTKENDKPPPRLLENISEFGFVLPKAPTLK